MTTAINPSSHGGPSVDGGGDRQCWVGPRAAVRDGFDAVAEALGDLPRAFCVVESNGQPSATMGGVVRLNGDAGQAMQADGDTVSLPLLAHVPAVTPAQLGDRSFCDDHRLRFGYMTGAMANGIASPQLVEAAAKVGVLGSYGAAGQSIAQVTAALDYLQARLGDNLPFACNLIHSPNEPAHEAAVVELYLQRNVRLLEASAYLDLTLPAVRYRVADIHCDAQTGRVIAPNRFIAKASRIEVATKWFSPPPQRFLDELVSRGDITREQSHLARQIPMAQDLTAEADSGGHTDNRPLVTLLPTLLALRDRMQAEHGYDAKTCRLRVGAAGGISTPSSAAAAFAMGAAYIVTGTVNQACVESGSSDAVRQMLAQTEQADVTMAPAADMFEMGVKLQVLKRGTMFAMRAQKLFELYRAHDSLESLPASDRANIEKTIFRATLDEVWQKTRDYFAQFDPSQIEKAHRDPKHRMALVFRWYLGLSSRWANAGEPTRQIDYQVWCGPAMGAFNEWAKGSHLEQAENRRVADVVMNLLYGAAVMTRANQLRMQWPACDANVMNIRPMPMDQLAPRMTGGI